MPRTLGELLKEILTKIKSQNLCNKLLSSTSILLSDFDSHFQFVLGEKIKTLETSVLNHWALYRKSVGFSFGFIIHLQE